MGVIEIAVISYLAILGLLAYHNSRKVSQQLKKFTFNK